MLRDLAILVIAWAVPPITKRLWAFHKARNRFFGQRGVVEEKLYRLNGGRIKRDEDGWPVD